MITTPKLKLKVELNGTCGLNHFCTQTSEIVINIETCGMVHNVEDFLFSIYKQGWKFNQQMIKDVSKKILDLYINKRITQVYKKVYTQTFSWGSLHISVKLC